MDRISKTQAWMVNALLLSAAIPAPAYAQQRDQQVVGNYQLVAQQTQPQMSGALQSADAQPTGDQQLAQQQIAQQQTAAAIDEIVVEGKAMGAQLTPIATEISKYGSQVQVIDSFEIDTGGFTNFGELASGLIRGANIGYSPDEGEFTIRIDGGTDRDTLLLLDGVPTFDRGTPLETIWGATSIDPRMIESVEIFRGGQSLYFGGNGGLGVVSVNYKKPDGTTKGEFGTYVGSFKTREVYGNTSFGFGTDNAHSLMFYGRSYETDAHNLFDESAYSDIVLEAGGKHEFPYAYNLVGMKYFWQIADETELRLGAEYATVDFRDSFPNDHVYNPNYTQFPIFSAKFRSAFTDRLRFEGEAYYTQPRLKNSEVDIQACRIPQSVLNPATGRPFTRASDFEAFARANNIPAGCITNPETSTKADGTSRDGFYVDAQGRIKGTLQNPFRIGDAMGFVIQSTAAAGTGIPVKGFGDGTQFGAGYRDYGANGRFMFDWTDTFSTVTGAQYISYKDDSAAVYGVSDQEVRTVGVYHDFRANLPVFEGLNVSLAGRYDLNNTYADEFTWKYGIRQELPGGFYVRSNGGTSYSSPTLAETGAYSNRVDNPSLKTQRVETYGVGAGINGDVMDGTYNVEIGYFDTVISNLFGADDIRDVCPGVDATRTINPNIITPTEFCTNFRQLGFTPLDFATFNLRQKQKIKGYSFDLAFDVEPFTVDLSYTKQDSLEPNPIFGLTAIRAGTGQALTTVVPGDAGSKATRQSGERPEWMASALVTYKPTEDWIISLNPRLQGAEWLYVQNTAARLVDAAGNQTNPHVNFGDYFVMNASVQYLMGDDQEHRFMLRIVNLLDKKYSERGGAADRSFTRAGVRGEIGANDPGFYYTYAWNGKPLSFWLQYEYNF